MTILGIETSCDDTGVGIIDCGKKNCRILANVVSSQISIHAPFGGVVPNLAARAHLKNIKPCLKQALKRAGNPKIDLIAVTTEPGLIPCLLVGENFAKALAYNWRLPLVKINHLEAHIFANWLSTKVKPSQFLRRFNLRLTFPILSLIVSGGHTQLVLMDKNKRFRLIGQTRDDAAGEAFDKVAKLLGLGYPGGPAISQRAEKGNAKAFDLPRPMLHSVSPDGKFDFSFSGLKTAVLYKVKKSPYYSCHSHTSLCPARENGNPVCLNCVWILGSSPRMTHLSSLCHSRIPLCHSCENGNPGVLIASGFPIRSGMTQRERLDSRINPRFLGDGSENDTFQKAKNNTLRSQKFINDMAASFQQAVIDVLISKTVKAAKKYKVKTIVLAGGVAANKNLRKQMEEKIKNDLVGTDFQIPDLGLCLDNGAMVAAAAWQKKVSA